MLLFIIQILRMGIKLYIENHESYDSTNNDVYFIHFKVVWLMKIIINKNDP